MDDPESAPETGYFQQAIDAQHQRFIDAKRLGDEEGMERAIANYHRITAKMEQEENKPEPKAPVIKSESYEESELGRIDRILEHGFSEGDEEYRESLSDDIREEALDIDYVDEAEDEYGEGLAL